MSSRTAIPSGFPIPAAELLEVIGIGGAGTAGGAALLGAPDPVLQLLQQREIGARPPGQGGKAQGQGKAGEGIAEQSGQGPPGCLLAASGLRCDEFQSWESLSVAASVPSEQGHALHQGMGSDQEVGQDHGAGAAPLAVGGMGSGG